MTPRAQEILNLARRAEKKLGETNWRPVAERLATALAAMEQDLSSGFIREHLMPGSIDEFHGRKPPDASK